MAPTPLADAAFPSALPSRWTRAQRCKNTCIYVVVRAAYAAFGALPFSVAWALAHGVGLAAWLVAGPQRRRATAQMTWAMPALEPRQVRRQVRGMFVHLALCVVEVMHLPRLLAGRGGIEMTPEHRDSIAAALHLGRGVVAVSGHIGNWELLAHTFAHAGFAVHTFAKPLYDPRLTAWVDRERRTHGLNVLWRGAPGGVKQMLRVFRRGEMLALLIDQDTRVEGCFVPFFGRPAHTPSAPASLAVRLGAPILVAFTQRVKGGHKLILETIQVRPDADRDAEIVRVTALLSARLQAAIEQAPAQWVWLHARWKQQSPRIAP